MDARYNADCDDSRGVGPGSLAWLDVEDGAAEDEVGDIVRSGARQMVVARGCNPGQQRAASR